MTAETRPFRLLACLACAALLGGCSTFQSSGKPAEQRYRQQILQDRREKSFQSIWRGKPYNALLDSFGAPKMLMNVPGQRPVPTSVAVYGVMDAESQCIDAFTLVVVHGGEVVVADYFCR